MQKTKLGITVGALGAITFFAGFFGGYLAAIVLAGYALLFEENAWLKRSVVKAVVLMVFFSVTVSIFEAFRTCLDPLKFILTLIFDGVLHKLLHLSFLECKLFLIRKILIGTSSTFSKMRAWTLYLKW